MADIRLHRAWLFLRGAPYSRESTAADLAATEALTQPRGCHRREEEPAGATSAIAGTPEA